MSDNSNPSGWVDRFGIWHEYLGYDGKPIPPGKSWSTPIDLRPILDDVYGTP